MCGATSVQCVGPPVYSVWGHQCTVCGATSVQCVGPPVHAAALTAPTSGGDIRAMTHKIPLRVMRFTLLVAINK